MRKYDNSPGTCTNVRSCPKVREEHKFGVPLTVCSYISGVPIICCPVEGGSSKPAWSQPESTLNTNFGGQRISAESMSNSLRKHSEILTFYILECDEYAELTKEKVYVNPLSLGTVQHAISLSKCDATTPLIVGGERAKNGEYPHSTAIGWISLDGTLEFKCGGSLISDK